MRGSKRSVQSVYFEPRFLKTGEKFPLHDELWLTKRKIRFNPGSAALILTVHVGAVSKKAA